MERDGAATERTRVHWAAGCTESLIAGGHVTAQKVTHAHGETVKALKCSVRRSEMRAYS